MPLVARVGGTDFGAADVGALLALSTTPAGATGRVGTGQLQILINGGGGYSILNKMPVQCYHLSEDFALISITVTGGGSGYTSAPTVTVTGGGPGSGTVATAILDGTGHVHQVNVTTRGTGFTGTPVIGFTGGGGSGATATPGMSRYLTGVYFGGYVNRVGIVQLPGTGYKQWTLDLVDYNVQFKRLVGRASYRGALLVPPGTFAAQAEAIVAYVNAGAATGIDAVTQVANLTDTTILPQLGPIGGKSLEHMLQALFLSAQGVNSAIRPQMALAPDATVGPTRTAFGGPLLYVYDGALLPSPRFTYSDAPTGGERPILLDPGWAQTLDSADLVDSRESVHTSNGLIYLAQVEDAIATYPNECDPAGAWWDEPLTDSATYANGHGAAGTATLSGDAVGSLELTAGGFHYYPAPPVSLVGGGGFGARVLAEITASGVVRVAVTDAGTGYTAPPLVHFDTAHGSGATATATLDSDGGVSGVTMTAAGVYTAAPAVTFTPVSGGAGAAGAAALDGSPVTRLDLLAGGSGYTSAPAVIFGEGQAFIETAVAATAFPRETLTIPSTAFPPPLPGESVAVKLALLGLTGDVYQVAATGCSFERKADGTELVRSILTLGLPQLQLGETIQSGNGPPVTRVPPAPVAGLVRTGNAWNYGTGAADVAWAWTPSASATVDLYRVTIAVGGVTITRTTPDPAWVEHLAAGVDFRMTVAAHDLNGLWSVESSPDVGTSAGPVAPTAPVWVGQTNSFNPISGTTVVSYTWLGSTPGPGLSIDHYNLYVFWGTTTRVLNVGNGTGFPDTAQAPGGTAQAILVAVDSVGQSSPGSDVLGPFAVADVYAPDAPVLSEGPGGYSYDGKGWIAIGGTRPGTTHGPHDGYQVRWTTETREQTGSLFDPPDGTFWFYSISVTPAVTYTVTARAYAFPFWPGPWSDPLVVRLDATPMRPTPGPGYSDPDRAIDGWNRASLIGGLTFLDHGLVALDPDRSYGGVPAWAFAPAAGEVLTLTADPRAVTAGDVLRYKLAAQADAAVVYLTDADGVILTDADGTPLIDGGGTVPTFARLLDADGAYLTDADGAYLTDADLRGEVQFAFYDGASVLCGLTTRALDPLALAPAWTPPDTLEGKLLVPVNAKTLITTILATAVIGGTGLWAAFVAVPERVTSAADYGSGTISDDAIGLLTDVSKTAWATGPGAGIPIYDQGGNLRGYLFANNSTPEEIRLHPVITGGMQAGVHLDSTYGDQFWVGDPGSAGGVTVTATSGKPIALSAGTTAQLDSDGLALSGGPLVLDRPARVPTRVVSAAFALPATDQRVFASVGAGTSYALTLPAASAVPSSSTALLIICTSAGIGGSIVVTPAGSDTIEGAASVTLSSTNAKLELISNGVNRWYQR